VRFPACERVRKAAANKRQPQRAERAMYAEQVDAFLSASEDELGGLRGAILSER
jgi:hypothetical protein